MDFHLTVLPYHACQLTSISLLRLVCFPVINLVLQAQYKLVYSLRILTWGALTSLDQERKEDTHVLVLTVTTTKS